MMRSGSTAGSANQDLLNTSVSPFDSQADFAMSHQVSPGTITSAPNWYDDTGGRPPRINQWNISLQRQVLPDLMVEAAYVGNRSSHILSNNVLQLNASSPQMLQQKGFDITNAADRAILTSPWNSPAAAARGIKAPYPGYPTGLTVAQVLRPYPQFGSIASSASDRGFS